MMMMGQLHMHLLLVLFVSCNISMRFDHVWSAMALSGFLAEARVAFRRTTTVHGCPCGQG